VFFSLNPKVRLYSGRYVLYEANMSTKQRDVLDIEGGNEIKFTQAIPDKAMDISGLAP